MRRGDADAWERYDGWADRDLPSDREPSEAELDQERERRHVTTALARSLTYTCHLCPYATDDPHAIIGHLAAHAGFATSSKEKT